MKLKSFNSTNMRGATAGESSISFSRQGIINISQMAVDAIGLKIGDVISLEQDEENPQDWYLMKNPEGFKVRQYKGSNGLCFNAAALAKSFLDLNDYTNTHSASFRLITEPVEIDGGGVKLYPVITTKPLREKVYAEPGEEEEEEEN